jgi:hypothetical protein
MVKKKPLLTTQVNIRLTDAMAAALEKRATDEQRTMSDMARILLGRALEEGPRRRVGVAS